MLPTTRSRVPMHTSQADNVALSDSLDYYAHNPSQIDAPQTLVSAASCSYSIPFQHAVQGWCPPVPVLREMGFLAVDYPE